MSKFNNTRYDEIKNLVNIARNLNEDTIKQINIGKDIEDNIENKFLINFLYSSSVILLIK
jgi:hypothetical protein